MHLYFCPMRKSLSIFITIVITMSLFSLFGCFKKKPSEPKNIGDWLNVQWEGRFEVIATPTNFTDKEYYFNKRKSVIAETADPEVQFVLNWVKGEKDVGLTREIVDEAYSIGRKEVTLAREILKSLKDTGIDSVSVGTSGSVGYVFVFTEPMQERREKMLQEIIDVLRLYRETKALGFELSIMEPMVFSAEFKEIIPEGHWLRLDSWQRSHEILRLSIPADQPIQSEQLNAKWYFNTNSDRLFTFMDSAYAEVLTWAKTKMPKGGKIEDTQGAEYWLDEQDGMLVHISFPFFETEQVSEGQERSGVISGVFDVDNKTFTEIKINRDEIGDE